MKRGQVDDAVEAFRRLALSPVGGQLPPSVGANSARIWADHAFATGNWEDVIQAERAAGPHLDVLRSDNADLFSRDAFSSDRGRLATQAAFAWAKSGSVSEARGLLEAGRNTMLAEHFDVAVPAEPVPDREPSSGPDALVIYLLATGAGGVALPDGDAPVVWLDQLGGGLWERWVPYGKALDALRRNRVLGLKTWVTEVEAMLAFLQDALAPLYSAFPNQDLALVATGVLTLLPLTAAALGPEPPRRGLTVVPSRRLSGSRPARAIDRVLAVIDTALPAIGWESSGVASFFAESSTAPSDATAEDILAALPAGGVAHFACHARAESGSPLQSAIILPGGDHLTVGQILGAAVPAVQTVVISACESGLAGPYVIDETVSLPAALLAAGCGGVLSTLWQVEDVSTALLMLQFYWQWRHEDRPAPLALALSQHWQRTATDDDKCAFVKETLVGAGILNRIQADDMAKTVQDRSAARKGKAFTSPYYWAGFTFSGC